MPLNNGTRTRVCPYCKRVYTFTNFMRRWKSEVYDQDGRLLDDAHKIACYRKQAKKGDPNA